MREVVGDRGLDVAGGFSMEDPRASSAGSPAVAVGHTCVLPYGVRFEASALHGDAVDVHGTIAALSRNVFVEWVPCYTLDVVGVLSDLPDTFSVNGSKHSCSVVGAACDDVFACRTPGEVVYLHLRASERDAWFPVLLLMLQILGAQIAAIGSGLGTRRRCPDDYHPVVSRRCNSVAIRGPPNDVHSG